MKQHLVSQLCGLFALTLSSQVFAVGFRDYTLGEFYPVSEVEEEVVTKAAEAVVYFKGATGFIISSDGYILTNYHVWDGFGDTGKVYRQKTEDGYQEALNIKLITKSEKYDMALYKTDAKNLPFVPLRTKAVTVGDPVFIIGHPHSKPQRVSFGKVLAKNINISGRPSIEYSAQTWWGSSGSPVLDQEGRVVALHWGWDAEGLSNGRLTGVPIALMAKDIPEIEALASNKALTPKEPVLTQCADAALFSLSTSLVKAPSKKNKHYELQLSTQSTSPTCAAAVSSVTYTLHPTFPNPERQGDATSQNFPLKISAWGMFPMTAEVAFTDGSSVVIDGYVGW